MNKKSIVFSLSAAFIIIIAVIVYIAADRFLFEHIEIDLTKNKTNLPLENEHEGDSDYTATDMSYLSSDKTINISKVITGSGKNQLVYFVADIKINDDTMVKTAFAKDKFGTNIIEEVSSIASRNNAILAINGDYYGFRNDGIIIRNGVIYRNSPARTGLAIYKNGTMEIYDETKTSAQNLIDDGVFNTLSFGPALIENGSVLSGIDEVEVDTNFGNHSVQGKQPRTGIGIIEKNHLVFVVADGRNSGYSTGVTMTQFANIFKDLGCIDAYNLDGGGSSEMWFMGNIINTPCNKGGSERGTSDIIYIG
ncbi:MAG: exopolysaccharide biosynthesis protein [Clostridiales bacterium]|nr:MAG: exopolysaccharide biosynthesis protein [Clostridiales bacterium]